MTGENSGYHRREQEGKKLSQTCTHTAASSYLLLPRQTEALHRNSSFTVEVNIFVPLFFFFFLLQLLGGKGASFPPLSQCDCSSLCPAGSPFPQHLPRCKGDAGAAAVPPWWPTWSPSLHNQHCFSPSRCSLKPFLLRENPPHGASSVESKIPCLVKTFLETACAHALLRQHRYGFSSD